MKIQIVIVTIFTLLFSACASVMRSDNTPLLFEESFNGTYTTLAHCVVKNLYADSRPFMQLYHYKTQIYPAIDTVRIFAYDTRFLPYIYPSNSPQNPDAVRDYISAEAEILYDVQQVMEAEYANAFVLTIKKTATVTSYATIKGNSYIGGIAWNYLQACAVSTTGSAIDR